MYNSVSLRIILACVALLHLVSGCVTTPKQADDLPELVFPIPPDQARMAYERTIFSSADSLPKEKSSTSELKSILSGESETSGKALGKPYGIAVAKGVVFVSDTIHRTIMRFDPGHGEFTEIGKSDPGTLTKPMGISMDAKGNLYVMDATAKRIMVYANDGKYLRSIGKREDFDHPSSVAVNPEGTRVFAVDTAGPRSTPEFHRIRVYDATNGNFLYDIGHRGSGDGEFNLLRDATVGKDGLLYVVDGGNFRVQVFNQDGTFVKKFGEVGRHLGQFARPKGIATDSENNLYISDASHGNFQIFNKDGQLLLFVGDRGKDTERAKYLLPAMISVDEDGRVYMVDQGYRKVDIYRPMSLDTKSGFLGKAYETLAKMKPSKNPKDTTPAKPQEGAPAAQVPAKASTQTTTTPPIQAAPAPQAAAPQAAAPKATAPQATAPEITKPTVTTTQATAPEITKPTVTTTQATAPEITKPTVTTTQAPTPSTPVANPPSQPSDANRPSFQLKGDSKIKRLGEH